MSVNAIDENGGKGEGKMLLWKIFLFPICLGSFLKQPMENLKFQSVWNAFFESHYFPTVK